MLTLTGKPVYGAVSIGPLAFFRRRDVSAAVRTITDVPAEIKRFHSARGEAIAQLYALYEKALATVGEEDAAIFEIHQMMLEDDEYIESAETFIREEKLNAEAAVERTAHAFADMFRNMDDAYMQGRAADVLEEKILVCRASGTCVTPKECQRKNS